MTEIMDRINGILQDICCGFEGSIKNMLQETSSIWLN